MPSPSSIGFGRNPYGHVYGGTPFKTSGAVPPFLMVAGYGLGDWAEEVTWKILPAFMRDEDGTEGAVPEPLRGFLDCVKPLLNEQLSKWRLVPTLWDANTCPLPQLPALAYTIGISLDSTKPERLQRSEVLNATQLFLFKGTDKGYSILAAFEDLLVEITPLWSSACQPPAMLSDAGPSTFYSHLDEVAADEIPLDATYDDQYALWPVTLYHDAPYRSHSLRLTFYPQVSPNQDFTPDVASRVADRLLRYKPIHVEIDRITFDSLRGSSQAWTERALVVDNGAAGMWTEPSVTALEVASSAPWVADVNATLTP